MRLTGRIACPPAPLPLPRCSKLKFRVLDECDEMLNMGFVDDVEKILNAGVDTATVQVGALLPSPCCRAPAADGRVESTATLAAWQYQQAHTGGASCGS